MGHGSNEAAAIGTPLVSTDCPSGAREILEGCKWGRLVPVGQIDALADAIVDALDNPGPDPSPRGAEFTVERAVDRYHQLAFPALTP
jgi:glycosyltransferase involved in cell wall biosynthesis